MKQAGSKLRWRCRRGMREMDVLLERFLTHGYPLLREDERERFADLLDQPDQDLLAWILQREQPPESFEGLIRVIQEHI